MIQWVIWRCRSWSGGGLQVSSCRLNHKTLETVVRSRLIMNQAFTRDSVSAVISAGWFWCCWTQLLLWGCFSCGSTASLQKWTWESSCKWFLPTCQTLWCWLQIIPSPTSPQHWFTNLTCHSALGQPRHTIYRWRDRDNHGLFFISFLTRSSSWNLLKSAVLTHSSPQTFSEMLSYSTEVTRSVLFDSQTLVGH